MFGVVVVVEVGVEVVVVVGVVVEVGVWVVVVVGVGVEVGVVLTKKRRTKMARTITVSEETYEAIKAQLKDGDFELSCFDAMIGKSFFLRTVTYHFVGKVKARIGNFLHLTTASWVADSGRFMNAIKEGTLKEVEPLGDAFVNLDTVTDFIPWKHALPTEQK